MSGQAREKGWTTDLDKARAEKAASFAPLRAFLTALLPHARMATSRHAMERLDLGALITDVEEALIALKREVRRAGK